MAGKAVLTAGAGALATMAGIYIAKKVKKLFRNKRTPKMRLFHKHLFLSTRCTWFISELGAESEFELMDEDSELFNALQRQDHHTDSLKAADTMLMAPGSPDSDYEVVEYRKPSNEDIPDYDDTGPPDVVPALVVNDDFTMVEGAAICMYLADSYGQFLPDQEHKAEYYSWIVYSAATFDNILKTLQQQLVDTAVNQRDSETLDHALKGFDAFCRALSETLDKQSYLCGEKFTAADCVLGFTLWWAYTIEGGALLQDYPVLINYLHRLKSRPAFQKTFGNEDTWHWGKLFPTYMKALRLL